MDHEEPICEELNMEAAVEEVPPLSVDNESHLFSFLMQEDYPPAFTLFRGGSRSPCGGSKSGCPVECGSGGIQVELSKSLVVVFMTLQAGVTVI